MQKKTAESWKNILQAEFKKTYFKDLKNFVDSEYIMHQCFPKKEDIFAAFNYFNFSELKVVIIGQDPYHNFNQADGLCFSVKENTAHPPSLVNIFKELTSDIDKEYPKSGNLQKWAEQGILLLNAILTVRAHNPRSHHKKGWETFTDEVIRQINTHTKGVVFLLWGGFAKSKARLIDSSKHYVLTAGHPSPLSANKGYWFGNKHFSKTNTILKKIHKSTINW